MRSNSFLVTAVGAALFASPGAFAYDFGLMGSKCATVKPDLCHVDIDDSGYQTVTSGQSWDFTKKTASVYRKIWTGYYVDRATKSLLYIKVAEQKDRSLCPMPFTSGYEITSAGTPPNSAPPDCRSEMASIGIYKAPANSKPTSVASKKTTKPAITADKGTTTGGNHASGSDSNADHSNTQGTTNNANTNADNTNSIFANFLNGRKQQTTFNTDNAKDQDALTDALNQETGQITINGKGYNKTADGKLEDPLTGKWSRWDPSTKKIVEDHSATEYVDSRDGHIYHSLADAKAAGLDSDMSTVVNHYDKSGNKTTFSMEDAKKEAQESIKDHAKEVKTARENNPKQDDCDASYQWALKNDPTNAAKYRCSTTNTIAKATDVSNQVLTGAGRAVVNTLGATAAQNAAQGGTFIDAQKASAKMAKTAFTYETALGTANVVAAAVLGKKASQHKKAYNNLKDYTLDEKAVAKIKRDSGGLYDGSEEQAEVKAAMKEQAKARDIASIQAFKSAMVAAQSAAAAIVAKQNQKNAQDNANRAQDAANKISNNTFGYDPNTLAPPQQAAQYDPNGMAATGGAENGGAATTTTDNVDPNAPTGALLGDGNDLSGGDDSLNAPKAGAFKEGTTAGGPGGGGAPGVGASGGGSLGGGPTTQDESKAAYASEFGTKERYESGGGTGYAPKAGGAAAGKGGDGGIDLNGLLAQFLPKADDESAKHSILDSVAFGGNRHIATEEPASYLDKNADLFQRIHETMSEKNRRGQLGI